MTRSVPAVPDCTCPQDADDPFKPHEADCPQELWIIDHQSPDAND